MPYVARNDRQSVLESGWSQKAHEVRTGVYARLAGRDNGGAQKQRERSLEPLPLTIFTARNMPFGRDDPSSLNQNSRLFEPIRQCCPVKLLFLWGYALPPPYSAQLLASVERTITKERLTRYLGATRQHIPKALALYEYNVQLSEGLYGLLHGLTLPQLIECVEWVCTHTAQWMKAQFRYADAERILREVAAMNVPL
jgi:hypothetical protein